MIYYLVAILDSHSYSRIEEIQRDICLKYNLFAMGDKLPKLHITLETIEDPDLEVLDKAIKEVLVNYSSFKTLCKGIICFEPPYKSVNLEIYDNGEVKALSSDLNATLKSCGLKVRKNIQDYKFHISLANTYFSNRDWSELEYKAACTFAKDLCCPIEINIFELQLWKPIHDESKMVVYTYTL